MAKFVYRGDKRSAEDIARKSKEGTRDYDSVYTSGIPTFKPKEGQNTIRVLPSGDPEDPDWDLTVQTHYNVGADEGRYLCLEKMGEGECPICAAAAKATDEEERDQLRVVKGCVVWIIDRDNEKAGPQLWSMPFTKIRNEIHSRSRDKKTGAPILVDDPEEGYDVFFERKGTGTKTAYSGVELDRDPSPLSESPKTQQRWLDYIADNPLRSVLNFYPPEHIEKVLLGQVERKKPEAVVEEEEVAAPTRASRRTPVVEEEEVLPARSSRRPAVPAEEEAEEPVADSRASRRRALLAEEDEPPFEGGTRRRTSTVVEEEEVLPARTSRRAAPVEDEEEVAPPARSSRRAAAPVEEEEEPAPVAAARRSLERLKPRR